MADGRDYFGGSCGAASVAGLFVWTLILISASCLPCRAALAMPSANEVLLSYERSLLPMQDCVAYDATTDNQYTGDRDYKFKPRRVLMNAQVRRNGGRFDVILEAPYWYENDEEPAVTFKERGILSNGQMVHYHGPLPAFGVYGERNGDLTIDSNTARWTPGLSGLVGYGSVLDGLVWGDDQQTLPEVLRGSTSMQLRDQMEVIDGHPTYVLEAVGSYGRHVLWLDPEYGFNPRRIVVQKRPDDLFDGKPLNTPVKYKASQMPAIPVSGKVRVDVTVNSIEISEVDGIFVATGAEIEVSHVYANGKRTGVHVHHRRENIDFTPDFEAMSAFLMNAPNGTEVSYRDGSGGGIEYEWRDGRVVPAVDMSDLARLDKAVDAAHTLLAEEPAETAWEKDISGSERRVKPVQKSFPELELEGTGTRRKLLFCISMVVLLFVGTGSVLILRCRKRLGNE